MWSEKIGCCRKILPSTTTVRATTAVYDSTAARRNLLSWLLVATTQRPRREGRRRERGDGAAGGRRGRGVNKNKGQHKFPGFNFVRESNHISSIRSSSQYYLLYNCIFYMSQHSIMTVESKACASVLCAAGQLQFQRLPEEPGKLCWVHFLPPGGTHWARAFVGY